jgi:hypothetical protein
MELSSLSPTTTQAYWATGIALRHGLPRGCDGSCTSTRDGLNSVTSLLKRSGALSMTEEVEVEVEVHGERRKIRVFLYRAGWDPDSSISLWALTSGNLARELLTGQLQLGDDIFVQREPASIPVAGDPDGGGVTYAALGKVMRYQKLPAGWPVVQTIDREGEVGDDSSLETYGVTYVDIGAPTGHTVASVFWDFFQQPGWQAREIIGASVVLKSRIGTD